MRRAVSSEVRSASSLRTDRRQAYPRPLARSTRRYSSSRAISASTGGGTRPSIGSPAATRARMSDDDTGSGSISKNATRSGRPSCASTASSRLRSTPGRVATPSRASSEHPHGLLPPEEARELVCPDEEQGVVEGECLERVDRAGELIERDLGLVERSERQLGEEEADLWRGRDVLVARLPDDANEQPVEVEPLDPPSRQLDVTDVRRVERAAEDADAHGSHSSSSSPISTSAPRRTPAPRSASSSSPSSGISPTTRKPRSVRSTRNDRRAAGAGR